MASPNRVPPLFVYNSISQFAQPFQLTTKELEKAIAVTYGLRDILGPGTLLHALGQSKAVLNVGGEQIKQQAIPPYNDTTFSPITLDGEPFEYGLPTNDDSVLQDLLFKSRQSDLDRVLGQPLRIIWRSALDQLRQSGASAQSNLPAFARVLNTDFFPREWERTWKHSIGPGTQLNVAYTPAAVVTPVVIPPRPLPVPVPAPGPTPAPVPVPVPAPRIPTSGTGDLGVDFGGNLVTMRTMASVLLSDYDNLEEETLRSAVASFISRFEEYIRNNPTANPALQVVNANRKALATRAGKTLPDTAHTWDGVISATGPLDYVDDALKNTSRRTLAAGDLFQLIGLGAGIFFNAIGSGDSAVARNVVWSNVLDATRNVFSEADLKNPNIDTLFGLRARLGFAVAVEASDAGVIADDAAVPFHVSPDISSDEAYNSDGFELNLGYGFGPADYRKGANYRAMLCMAEALVRIISSNSKTKYSIDSLLAESAETADNTWTLSYTEKTGAAAWGIFAALLEKTPNPKKQWTLRSQMVESWGKNQNVFDRAPSANMVQWLMDIFRITIFLGVFGKRFMVKQDPTMNDVKGEVYESDEERDPVNASGTFENNEFVQQLYGGNGKKIAKKFDVPSWSAASSKPLDENGDLLTNPKKFFITRNAQDASVHVVERSFVILSVILTEFGLHVAKGGNADDARLVAFQSLDTIHQDFISTVQHLVLNKVGNEVLQSGEFYDAALYEAYVRKICTQNANKGIAFFAQPYTVHLGKPSAQSVAEYEARYSNINAIKKNPGIVLHTAQAVPQPVATSPEDEEGKKEEMLRRMRAARTQTKSCAEPVCGETTPVECAPAECNGGVVAPAESIQSREEKVREKMRARMREAPKETTETKRSGSLRVPLINMEVEPSEERRKEIMERWNTIYGNVTKGMEGGELANELVECCKMIRHNGGTLQAEGVDMKKALISMRDAGRERNGLQPNFVSVLRNTAAALSNTEKMQKEP